MKRHSDLITALFLDCFATPGMVVSIRDLDRFKILQNILICFLLTVLASSILN
ncbi:MAG: hypothetical protein V2B14_04360 [bacterium]